MCHPTEQHPGVTVGSAGRWLANYLNLPKPQPRRPREPQLPSSRPPPLVVILLRSVPLALFHELILSSRAETSVRLSVSSLRFPSALATCREVGRYPFPFLLTLTFVPLHVFYLAFEDLARERAHRWPPRDKIKHRYAPSFTPQNSLRRCPAVLRVAIERKPFARQCSLSFLGPSLCLPPRRLRRALFTVRRRTDRFSFR